MEKNKKSKFRKIYLIPLILAGVLYTYLLSTPPHHPRAPPRNLSNYEKARWLSNTRQKDKYGEAIELCKSAVKDNNPADDIAAYKLWVGLAGYERMHELVKEKKSPLERQIGGLEAALGVYEEAAKAYPENSHFKDMTGFYQERINYLKTKETEKATETYK
ncbi:MAG: hypothetical protein Q7J54_05755 [Candidatus Woesearchaeota archaeon]|nr:hypothetical protein [Candidatus Woesearchaeota archaeon]